MAVPTDRNVVQKEAEKKAKIEEYMYTGTMNVEHEIMIIPVITGATGIVPRGSKKNLEAIPGKESTDLLQKTVTQGISHIIQKILQFET